MRLTSVVNFEKWHGNGNDFVIINSIDKKIRITKTFIKKTANRNKGIGFDQLIFVTLPTKESHDFFIRFFNSDGSEAGMCLNGIRCAARYIWNNSFAPLNNICIKTKTKVLTCSPVGKSSVNVEIIFPEKINHPNLERKISKKISKNFFLLNTGNNHLFIKFNSIEKIDLNGIYSELSNDIQKHEMNLSIFKKTKNVIDLRTYENGVGETLSCGSASLCVASNFLSKKDDLITVKTFGGEIIFKKIKDAILMKGPATFIYKGNINE